MVQWLEQRTGAIKVDAANAQPNDALRTELWPVTLGLRTVGAMPISTDRRTGDHVFRVTSLALAYSVLVYVALMVTLGFVHRENFEKLQNKSFGQAMPVVVSMFYDVLIVVIPWFYWLEASALARHLGDWTRLQANFEHLTGTQLHLGLRRRAIVLACTLSAASVLLELWYAPQKRGPSDSFELATSIFQDILRNLLCARWYLQCKAVVAVSQQTLDKFKMEITQMHCARVLEYRLFWLRLSAQTRDIGTACGYTHGFFVEYLFVSLMMAIYQTVTADREVHSDWVDLVEGVVITCCLFAFCDSAHRATAHVGNEWVNFLLRVRGSPSLDMHRQIGDFLETCSANAPIITLSDFVIVNRNLLVSVTSAMITYLVILVQFKMDSSEVINIANHTPNATNA